MGGARKRISNILTDGIYDPLSFLSNCSSENARFDRKITYSYEAEFWLDKHYCIRLQHGDENGKREGIDLITVSNLIEKSFGLLIIYGLRVEKFNFLNFLEHRSNPLKIILQEKSNNQILNVVIECHFIEINLCEITVKTAMVEDNFRVRDGQYLLEIINQNSVLKRFVNGKTMTISEL